MMPHHRPNLRDRIDELEETCRQLREALAPMRLWPPTWRLTSHEGRVLSALLEGRNGAKRKESLYTAIYGTDGGAEIKIIDAHISRLRAKIGHIGIRIETVWGEGYSLPPASAALLREALADPWSERWAASDAALRAPLRRRLPKALRTGAPEISATSNEAEKISQDHFVDATEMTPPPAEPVVDPGLIGGEPPVDLAPVTIRTIRAMRAAGMTPPQIARQVDQPVEAVRRVLG